MQGMQYNNTITIKTLSKATMPHKCTCHCKDLLSAGWEGQSHREGAEDDEAGLHQVPPPVKGRILPGNQHIQCVSAGHLQATQVLNFADDNLQRGQLSHTIDKNCRAV